MSEQAQAESNNAGNSDSNATGQNAAVGQPAISFATEAEFQAKIEEMLKERLNRADRKAQEMAQKAREQAEAEAAQRNGEWEKLAQQHAAKLAAIEPELEAIKPKLERYEKALTSQLEAQRKALPKPILSLLDNLDPASQLEWLASNKEAIQASAVAVPATPKAQASIDAATQEAARKAAASMYSQF